MTDLESTVVLLLERVATDDNILISSSPLEFGIGFVVNGAEEKENDSIAREDRTEDQ